MSPTGAGRLRFAARALLTAFLLIASAHGAAAFRPAHLQTEYRTEPLGVDTPRPRFSWKLESADPAARGQRQSAYRVRVGSTAVQSEPAADVWDSGVVQSDATSQIEYAGPALRSLQACFWSVSVQDQNGEWSPWSKPTAFRMGLLSEGDWTAKWIGAESKTPYVDPASLPLFRRKYPAESDPWLRRDVDLERAPTSAVASVASVGYHELYVNGTKVSDAVLMPNVANHRRRARYVSYDIASLLKPGRNVIGLWLGASWSIFPEYVTRDKPRAPIAKAQFDFTFADRSTSRVATDETWKTHRSPNRLLGAWNFRDFGGEEYDARLDARSWLSTDANLSGWANARVYTPELVVSSDTVEPNRLLTKIQAVEVKEVSRGTYRVDMGRNYNGWFEAKVRGAPGDRITFEFAERETETATYGLHSAYIIGPDGQGTFTNHFNYMTGRWITIRGLKARPALSDFSGALVRNDFARASSFESSNEILNRVYETTLWTYENLALGGFIVDCPHRERMGYGGDAHATTTTGFMNYRPEALYTKWAQDWRDVQGTRSVDSKVDAREAKKGEAVHPGEMPHTAPTYWGGGGPSWGGFCVHLPWEMYRVTGDKRILKDQFDSITRWLAYLDGKSSGNLLRRWGGEWDFLGDWLWPLARGINGDTRETLFFNNCYWIYNLVTAAEIARILGDEQQAAAWSARAAEARKAVHKEFFNESDSSYVNGYQAYLAIALAVDLPPPEKRAAVWARLELEILSTRQGHIHAGISGGAFLFKTLMEAHRNDLLYAMASKTDYPSWGDFLVNKGNTTIPEDWEDKGSRTHSSYLYVGAWFIQGVLGINADPAAPGFKRFIVRPGPIGAPGLDWARGHYDSVSGRIDVSWRVTDGTFQLDVTVPANTTASIYVPAPSVDAVREADKPVAEATGVLGTKLEGQNAVIQVASGTYRFTAPAPKPTRR